MHSQSYKITTIKYKKEIRIFLSTFLLDLLKLKSQRPRCSKEHIRKTLSGITSVLGISSIPHSYFFYPISFVMTYTRHAAVILFSDSLYGRGESSCLRTLNSGGP